MSHAGPGPAPAPSQSAARCSSSNFPPRLHFLLSAALFLAAPFSSSQRCSLPRSAALFLAAPFSLFLSLSRSAAVFFIRCFPPHLAALSAHLLPHRAPSFLAPPPASRLIASHRASSPLRAPRLVLRRRRALPKKSNRRKKKSGRTKKVFGVTARVEAAESLPGNHHACQARSRASASSSMAAMPRAPWRPGRGQGGGGPTSPFPRLTTAAAHVGISPYLQD